MDSAARIGDIDYNGSFPGSGGETPSVDGAAFKAILEEVNQQSEPVNQSIPILGDANLSEFDKFKLSLPEGQYGVHDGTVYLKENGVLVNPVGTPPVDPKEIYNNPLTTTELQDALALTESGDLFHVGGKLYENVNGNAVETFAADNDVTYISFKDTPTLAQSIGNEVIDFGDKVLASAKSLFDQITTAGGLQNFLESNTANILQSVILGGDLNEAVANTAKALAEGGAAQVIYKTLMQYEGVNEIITAIGDNIPLFDQFAGALALNLVGNAISGDLSTDNLGSTISTFALSYAVSEAVSYGIVQLATVINPAIPGFLVADGGGAIIGQAITSGLIEAGFVEGSSLAAANAIGAVLGPVIVGVAAAIVLTQIVSLLEQDDKWSVHEGTSLMDVMFADSEWAISKMFQGDDAYFGYKYWNKAIGGEGNDVIYGFDNSLGNTKTDELYGQDGNDFIDGKASNDDIYGGGGSDWLQGGSGNDKIHGGDDPLDRWTSATDDADDTIKGGDGEDKRFKDCTHYIALNH